MGHGVDVVHSSMDGGLHASSVDQGGQAAKYYGLSLRVGQAQVISSAKDRLRPPSQTLRILAILINFNLS